MDYEPKTQTIFTVEIGDVDIHFAELPKAAEFFAKIVEAPLMKIKREWGGGRECFIATEKKIQISMKQQTVDIYPNEEAYEFSKRKNKDKE
jgi:hypothetical protein